MNPPEDVIFYIRMNRNKFCFQGHVIKNSRGVYLFAFRENGTRHTFSIGKSDEAALRVKEELSKCRLDPEKYNKFEDLYITIRKINAEIRKVMKEYLERLGYHLHGWTLRKRRKNNDKVDGLENRPGREL